MVPLVHQQATQHARGEAAVTAAALRRQMDTMLGVVTANAEKAAALLGKPCQEVLGQLTRMSSLNAMSETIKAIHAKGYQ